MRGTLNGSSLDAHLLNGSGYEGFLFASLSVTTADATAVGVGASSVEAVGVLSCAGDGLTSVASISVGGDLVGVTGDFATAASGLLPVVGAMLTSLDWQTASVRGRLGQQRHASTTQLSAHSYVSALSRHSGGSALVRH